MHNRLLVSIIQASGLRTPPPTMTQQRGRTERRGFGAHAAAEVTAAGEMPPKSALDGAWSSSVESASAAVSLAAMAAPGAGRANDHSGGTLSAALSVLAVHWAASCSGDTSGSSSASAFDSAKVMHLVRPDIAQCP